MTHLRSTIEAFLDDPADPRHGTWNGYINMRCRCDRCREAHRVGHMAWRRRKGIRPQAEYRIDAMKHGISRYRAGCRCDVCRAAAAAQKRRQRANNIERYRALWRERARRRRAAV